MTLLAVRGWVDRISGAKTESAVVDLVRGYLATWTPSEIGEVSPEAWPGEGVSSKAEIETAAVQVKLEELRAPSDSPAAVSLQQLGQVLAAASTRFGQLSSPFWSERAQ